MAQQLIDRDGMAGIAGALPRRDRRRPVERQLALAHENADQRRDHRLGRGEAEDRRVDANALRIALGDDAAVLDHDDRLGVAERRRRGLGEGAIERGGKLRRRGRNHRWPGDLRQQRRLRFVCRRQRARRPRVAVIEIAAETLAIDGVAAAEAEQRHRDVLARAIDLVVDRPGDQAGARHRRGRLGEDPFRIEAGDESLRAEDVGDEAGRDLRHVAGARGRRAPARRARCVAARMTIRRRRVMACSGIDGVPAMNRERGRGSSPDLEIALAEICSGLADSENN